MNRLASASRFFAPLSGIEPACRLLEQPHSFKTQNLIRFYADGLRLSPSVRLVISLLQDNFFKIT
jgi:hypothetical protein